MISICKIKQLFLVIIHSIVKLQIPDYRSDVYLISIVQAYQMRPSIIFFDEIDGLAPVRSSRQDQIHR